MRLTILYFAFLLSATLSATLPDSARFVHDDQVVSWERLGETFKVTLSQGRTAPRVTILMSDAKCRVVSNGYRCFIKPVKKPGLLTTDVNFALTSHSLYDISTIVLINGSTTATHLIGRDFVEQPAFF